MARRWRWAWYAGMVSCRERGLDQDDAARVVALMARLGLPVRRGALAAEVTWERLRAAMAADKKARRSVPTFVLADRIGSVSEGCEVPEAVLKAAFDEME